MRKYRDRIVQITRSSFMVERRIGLFYKEKDGKLVLKTETHWTKISGVYWNSPWFCIWIQFRRFWNGSVRL